MPITWLGNLLSIFHVHIGPSLDEVTIRFPAIGYKFSANTLPSTSRGTIPRVLDGRPTFLIDRMIMNIHQLLSRLTHTHQPAKLDRNPHSFAGNATTELLRKEYKTQADREWKHGKLRM